MSVHVTGLATALPEHRLPQAPLGAAARGLYGGRVDGYDRLESVFETSEERERASFVPPEAPVSWPLLAVFVLLQAGRLWVIASLGPFWTTRIVSLPGVPLVRRGPFRWVRHPNYLVVAGELAVLPLAFGAWEIAVVASLLNLPLTAWRI